MKVLVLGPQLSEPLAFIAQTPFLKVESVAATGPCQFNTSEFSKEVFDSSAIRDGTPSVKASQNLTRYRWDPTEMSANEIEAFQRVAMFPLPRDGMDFADDMGMDKPSP